MLYTETVEPGTFSLLKELMTMPALAGFSLVGGTALSLRYGHRTSVDLDIFFESKIDQLHIVSALREFFGDRLFYEGTHPNFGVFCYIDGIKVDIVRYPHVRLVEPSIEDGIPMYDSIDIAAMKIQAILGRGKKKDFWDLAELLQHFSLKQIIEFHSQKFPSQMLLISIPQAITYFADADESEEPVSLKGQTWETVKHTISQKVSDYLR
jgi:Nucleotidyl transferase AbiEii toxin, Type IV TA system